MTRTMDREPVHGTSLEPLLAFVVGGVVVDGVAAPRLHWRKAGQGYADARSIAGEPVSIDDGVALRFALPGGAVDFILIEPAAVPGRYHVARLGFGGERVLDLRRRIISARGGVAQEGVPGSITIMSENHRPAIEIDLRDLDPGADGKAVALELVLRRDSDAATAAAGLEEVLAVLARDRRAQDEAMAGLDRRLTSLSTRLAVLEDAIGPGAGAPAGTLPQQLAALSGAVSAIARGQSEATAALAARVDQVGRSSAQAVTAASEGREAAARAAEASGRALETLQERVDRVIHAMENVFWRRWLRALRGRGQ